MAKETFQLAGNAAAIYEEQKVPSIFGPLAEATLDIAGLAENDQMLDVACGTGILARTARKRFGPGPRIVGVDLNAGMIAVARSIDDIHARACEWEVADVTAMPFQDVEFSAIFCQQGLQYFPDEKAALMEMKRLLRPGGQLTLSIWSGASDLFKILSEVISRHFDRETGERFLSPFSYAGRETLVDVMTELGYADVSRSEVCVDRVITNPATSLPKEIAGHPAGAAVLAKGEELIDRISGEILAGVTQFMLGENLVVPQYSHIFRARVP